MGIARVAKWLANNQTVNPPADPLNQIMEPVNPLGLWPLADRGMGDHGAGRGHDAGHEIRRLRSPYFCHWLQRGHGPFVWHSCAHHKILIYALAGLFFGSRLAQYSRLTQGDPTVAIGLELEIIAAVVIGGASLGNGIRKYHRDHFGSLDHGSA